MLLTEDEAKTKWCPMARGVKGKRLPNGTADVASPQAVFNRLDTGPGEISFPDCAVCIGSACMAWRWHKLQHASMSGAHPPRPELEFDGQYRGYCGQFGRAE